MPPIIPEAPWWANAILLAVGLVMTSVTAAVVAWIPTRRKLDRIDKQVTNSHPTNLRDDLTEVRDAVAQVLHAVEDLDASTARIDRRQQEHGRSIGGIRDDLRGVRGDLTGVHGDLREMGRRVTRLEEPVHTPLSVAPIPSPETPTTIIRPRPPRRNP